MEKIKIKTCVAKEYNNRKFWTIETEDGRHGSSTDDLTNKIGQEIEVDIKPAKEYNGVQQYYFNLPKQGGQSGGGSKFPAKDWSFEKRKFALSTAMELSKKSGLDIQVSQICKDADEFLNWLNK